MLLHTETSKSMEAIIFYVQRIHFCVVPPMCASYITGVKE